MLKRMLKTRLKRSAAIVSAVIVISLLASSETLAFNRCRRDGVRRTVATSYYSPYGYRGVAGQRYYSQPYYSQGSYSQPYYSQGSYSQPYYSQRSYSQPYYSGSRYYGSNYRGHSTRNLVLSVVAPAAVGAGIGAIAGGGKGAGIGAAIGGGGGALFYLLKHHGRRY